LICCRLVGWGQIATAAAAISSVLHEGGPSLLFSNPYPWLFGALALCGILGVAFARVEWARLLLALLSILTAIAWVQWVGPMLNRPSLPGNAKCIVFGLITLALTAAGAVCGLLSSGSEARRA